MGEPTTEAGKLMLQGSVYHGDECPGCRQRRRDILAIEAEARADLAPRGGRAMSAQRARLALLMEQGIAIENVASIGTADQWLPDSALADALIAHGVVVLAPGERVVSDEALERALRTAQADWPTTYSPAEAKAWIAAFDGAQAAILDALDGGDETS